MCNAFRKYQTLCTYAPIFFDVKNIHSICFTFPQRGSHFISLLEKKNESNTCKNESGGRDNAITLGHMVTHCCGRVFDKKKKKKNYRS